LFPDALPAMRRVRYTTHPYSAKGPDDKIKNALAGYMDMHVRWRGNPETEFLESAAIIHTLQAKKIRLPKKIPRLSSFPLRRIFYIPDSLSRDFPNADHL
jgi:hypothetical protein